MRNIPFIIVLSLLAGSSAIAAEDSLGTILHKIDEANKVGQHFAFEMKVESFRPGKPTDGNQIIGYSTYDRTLEVKSIIHFVAPRTVVGRKMLIEGSYIWASFPKTRNLIRLTPLQILLGEVAYGDVLRIVYGRDYDAKGIADTVLGDTPAVVVRMDLKPARAGSNYPKIDLVVERKSFRLLGSRIHGAGGRLIKTVRFEEPALFDGRAINRRIRIDDALKPGHYSVMQYLRMGDVAIDPAYFTKDMLVRSRIYAF
jgi:hypothetical protein